MACRAFDDGDADRSTDGGIRGRSSFRRSLITSVGSVVVIYTVGLIVVGGEDALAAFREASPLRLLGAMLLQAVVVLAWPLMHRSCLRAAGEDLTYPKVLQVYARSASSTSHPRSLGERGGASDHVVKGPSELMVNTGGQASTRSP